jgi:hypothetical protein
LTRELAQKYHDMEASPTERELNPGRVKHLTTKIEKGLAVSFCWASATVEQVGKQLRMNGNHSSSALVGLNGGFPDNLFVHLDEYEVEDIQGLALLFRQFDDRKSSRSSGCLRCLPGSFRGVAGGAKGCGQTGRGRHRMGPQVL